MSIHPSRRRQTKNPSYLVYFGISLEENNKDKHESVQDQLFVLLT